jgi:hypothetical protein
MSNADRLKQDRLVTVVLRLQKHFRERFEAALAEGPLVATHVGRAYTADRRGWVEFECSEVALRDRRVPFGERLGRAILAAEAALGLGREGLQRTIAITANDAA